VNDSSDKQPANDELLGRWLREASDGAPELDADHIAHVRQLLLNQAQSARINETEIRFWKRSLFTGSELMKRPIFRFMALSVACLIIATTWLFIPGYQTSAQAFDKIAETIVKAKSARYQYELTTELQSKQKSKGYFLAPNRYRVESPTEINISDFEAGKSLTLVPAQKQATMKTFHGKPKEGSKLNNQSRLGDQFERLRELLANRPNSTATEYKSLGQMVIDGKMYDGFQFESGLTTVKMWGDRATGHPVRIDTTSKGIVKFERTMSNFEFNVDLNESLFDLTPPSDYVVRSLDIDLSPATEQDLVAAFKACGEISGGDLPFGLDDGGIKSFLTTSILKQATGLGKEKKKKKEFSADDQHLVKKQLGSIARGLQFFVAELPESADAHYAGQGIKQGVADQPIFWYKPEGSTKYRVIYADLSVSDADTAPQIANAKRIERTEKAAE
jgi:outer membrane lipoprotein-sorting protein